MVYEFRWLWWSDVFEIWVLQLLNIETKDWNCKPMFGRYGFNGVVWWEISVWHITFQVSTSFFWMLSQHLAHHLFSSDTIHNSILETLQLENVEVARDWNCNSLFGRQRFNAVVLGDWSNVKSVLMIHEFRKLWTSDVCEIFLVCGRRHTRLVMVKSCNYYCRNCKRLKLQFCVWHAKI